MCGAACTVDGVAYSPSTASQPGSFSRVPLQMLSKIDGDESGLLTLAQVAGETLWLFVNAADESAWNSAGADLLKHGYGMIDGFLGAKLSLALREQARQKFASQASDFEHINTQFAQHGLCSTRLTELNTDDHSVTFLAHLTHRCETLVSHLARHVPELRTVSQRCKPMLAVYPGEGARYMRHGMQPCDAVNVLHWPSF